MSEEELTVAPVPDDTPDDLLDLAEEHLLHERNPELAIVLDRFNDRFSGAPLTGLQRGRLADLHGLLAANTDDFGVAEIAWHSALDLFAAAGDDIRRQTTRARLGMVLCRTGRAEVGLPIAQDATDYLLAHAPIDRHGSAHRRLAFTYMLSGRPDDAIAALDAAALVVSHSRDPLAGVRLTVEKAGVLAELGRTEEAAEAAELARIASREMDYPAGIATAAWIVGRVAQTQERLAAALEAYDEALATAVDPRFAREIRRQRAAMLAGTNKAADAIDDLIDELAAALAASETEAVATARFHLGVAYRGAGRPLEAVAILEELLAGLGPDDLSAEAVRHSLAQAYRALDRSDQAMQQLELIADSGRRRGSDALVGEMFEQIADVLDRLDRDALAAAKYLDASAAYRIAGLEQEAVRTCRRAALSHMWARQLDTAQEVLGRADMAALSLDSSTPTVRWERAMLAVDGARILAERGDLDAALIRCAPAQDIFTALGDTRVAAFAGAIQGGLLVKADRHAEAEPVLRAAIDTGDDDTRRRAAYALMGALIGLGRPDEAATVRSEYGFEPR